MDPITPLCAPLTRKFIILHDTTVDEWHGETLRDAAHGMPKSMRGIWPAVEEFLEGSGEWELRERFTHNNGLTVLARHPHA